MRRAGDSSLMVRRPDVFSADGRLTIPDGRKAARGDPRSPSDRPQSLEPPPSIVRLFPGAPRTRGTRPPLWIRRPDVCSADARRHLPRSGRGSPTVHCPQGPLRAGKEAPPSQLRPHGRSPFPRVAKLEVFPQRIDYVRALQEYHRSMARPADRTMLWSAVRLRSPGGRGNLSRLASSVSRFPSSWMGGGLRHSSIARVSGLSLRLYSACK